MNKYFQKTIYKKEIKYMLPIAIFVYLIIAVVYLKDFNIVNTHESELGNSVKFIEYCLLDNRFPYSIFGILITAIFACLPFLKDKQLGKHTFIHSLPYTKQQIYLSKIMAGLTCIISFTVIRSIFVTINYYRANFISNYIPLKYIIMWSILNILAYIMIYLLFSGINIVVFKPLYVFLLCIITSIAPYLLMLAFTSFFNIINYRTLRFINWLLISEWTNSTVIVKINELYTLFTYKLSYLNFSLKFIILIFISISLLYWIINIIKKIKIEKITKIFQFKFIKYIYQIGFSFCFGFGIYAILLYLYNVDYAIKTLIAVVFIVIGYVLFDIIVLLLNHEGYKTRNLFSKRYVIFIFTSIFVLTSLFYTGLKLSDKVIEKEKRKNIKISQEIKILKEDDILNYHNSSIEDIEVLEEIKSKLIHRTIDILEINNKSIMVEFQIKDPYERENQEFLWNYEHQLTENAMIFALIFRDVKNIKFKISYQDNQILTYSTSKDDIEEFLDIDFTNISEKEAVQWWKNMRFEGYNSFEFNKEYSTIQISEEFLSQ